MEQNIKKIRHPQKGGGPNTKTIQKMKIIQKKKRTLKMKRTQKVRITQK